MTEEKKRWSAVKSSASGWNIRDNHGNVSVCRVYETGAMKPISDRALCKLIVDELNHAEQKRACGT